VRFSVEFAVGGPTMAARTHSKLNYPRPWRLRVACLALVLTWLLGFSAMLGLACGFITDDHRLIIFSLVAIAVCLLLAALSFILANELPCNVCSQPVLLTKRCRKHVKARRMFSSYGLGIAVPALFTARYHCMHCGEKIPLGKRVSSNSTRKTTAAGSVTPATIPARRPSTEDDSDTEPGLPAPR